MTLSSQAWSRLAFVRQPYYNLEHRGKTVRHLSHYLSVRHILPYTILGMPFGSKFIRQQPIEQRIYEFVHHHSHLVWVPINELVLGGGSKLRSKTIHHLGVIMVLLQIHSVYSFPRLYIDKLPTRISARMRQTTFCVGAESAVSCQSRRRSGSGFASVRTTWKWLKRGTSSYGTVEDYSPILGICLESSSSCWWYEHTSQEAGRFRRTDELWESGHHSSALQQNRWVGTSS